MIITLKNWPIIGNMGIAHRSSPWTEGTIQTWVVMSPKNHFSCRCNTCCPATCSVITVKRMYLLSANDSLRLLANWQALKSEDSIHAICDVWDWEARAKMKIKAKISLQYLFSCKQLILLSQADSVKRDPCTVIQYSGVLLKWELFIKMRAACFAPSFLKKRVLEWG